MEIYDDENLRNIIKNGFTQLGAGDFTKASKESRDEIFERSMQKFYSQKSNVTDQ